LCLNYLNIPYYWKDDQVFEKNTDALIVRSDIAHFRPAEVDHLQGDSTKARKDLNWQPKHNLHSLIADMLERDLQRYYR
jgi:GDPmannose 4,6-dehydratase